jgi:ubiquinone/menaquinone biosynthesis C-methylase UbiE
MKSTDGTDHSFEPFARHEFYRETNTHLVDSALSFLERLDPNEQRRIIDLGCGTGAITRLVLAKVQDLGLKSQIFGIDPSPLALEKARQSIASAMVEFLNGSAENVSQLVSSADALFFCNAIHLIEDKHAVFKEIGKALNPGGVIAFNTTFFDGAYLPITEKTNRIWIVRAVQQMRREYPDVKIVKNAKTTAMRWLSPEQYQELLGENGFKVTHLECQQVEMTQESMEDISDYSLFIEGVLPGVPLDIGAEVLKHGIREAIKELKLATVPRYWLQVVAEKV